MCYSKYINRRHRGTTPDKKETNMETKTETTMRDVLNFIYRDATTDQLRELNEQIVAKIKTDRKVEAAVNMGAINVGDTVVLKNLSPKYINGVHVKVVGKKQTKLEVKLLDPVFAPSRVRDRFGTRTFTVPAGCVE